MTFYGSLDEHLHVDMYRILPVIYYITNEVCGCTAIIARTSECIYIRGNKHSEGLAVDLRIIHLSADVQKRYFLALNYALRRLCDVELKSDHIHIEFNPSLILSF